MEKKAMFLLKGFLSYCYYTLHVEKGNVLVRDMKVCEGCWWSSIHS